MRFAILADIHANWPALEAVLERIEERGDVHFTYCLGDLVGYYPFPRECLEALMALESFYSIRGNHDRYLLGEHDERVKPATLEIIDFSRRQLSPEQLAWVESLPDKRKIRDHFLLVHGSPRNKDEYLSGAERIERNLRKMEQLYPGYSICFFGHTHKPLVAAEDLLLERFHQPRTVELLPERTYLINPGSVGQPRDGCPLASFLVYDATARTVQFERVEYAYEETQRELRAHGFAEKLAARLATGK